MKMTEVRKKAKELGIKTGKMKKAELIQSIQRAEGNPQCYGRSNGNCSQYNCCFRSDCLKVRL